MNKFFTLSLVSLSLIAAGCNRTVTIEQTVPTSTQSSNQGVAIGEPNPSAADGNTGQQASEPVLTEEKDQSSPISKPESTPTSPSSQTQTPAEQLRLAAIHDGQYVEYSDENFQAAVERGDKIVLFFYASWCPTCKAADADFREHLSTDFPKSTTVLRVNYQSGGAMERRYGVTYQHTFVQVDYERNQITKWIGGKTAELIKNLK